MKIQLTHTFEEIINIKNLLDAWKEFEKGKKNKKDVQIFQMRLMDNIFLLHEELFYHTYNHGGYQAFKINDPKPRDIHKAKVRDRLLHHAIYRILYPFFNKTFIADSYSCRNNKGTHKAISRFREFAYKVSKNNTQTCWILKCDIRKFFANINHEVLLKILKEYIPDENIIWLLENVINSFISGTAKVGLPLGNLTSQLFVNIYMNKFDQFMKCKIKAKYYIRYADDFIVLSENKEWLEEQVFIIRDFLDNELKLELHPDKVSIKTLPSGIDFLGFVNFFDYRILRTKTKRRMMKKIKQNSRPESVASYLGIFKHCRGHKIEKKIRSDFIFKH